MGSVAISSIVFACVVGGAVLGIVLRVVLPKQQLTAEAGDIVKLGMGLVGILCWDYSIASAET